MGLFYPSLQILTVETEMIDIPVQFSPSHWSVQLQLYPRYLSMQVPPLEQGDVKHSLMSVKRWKHIKTNKNKNNKPPPCHNLKCCCNGI